MTHEQFVAAKPLQQDIDLLTSILTGYLAAEEPPVPLTLSDVCTICVAASTALVGNSGDARINEELHTTCDAFYIALRTSLTNLRNTFTADRTAI